jgi:hypothetical protein
MPCLTPDEPIGWYQWAYTDAPLSLAQASTATATLSAVPSVVQVTVSRWFLGRPAFSRYGAATAPLKQCAPYPSRDTDKGRARPTLAREATDRESRDSITRYCNYGGCIYYSVKKNPGIQTEHTNKGAVDSNSLFFVKKRVAIYKIV